MEIPDATKPWTQGAAIELATLMEKHAPEFGCHIGLTGGCLYKTGPRKDCDILIYRIRQSERIEIDGFLARMSDAGLIVKAGFGFCYKCEWQGKPLDLLIPEEPGNDYQSPDEDPQSITL